MIEGNIDDGSPLGARNPFRKWRGAREELTDVLRCLFANLPASSSHVVRRGRTGEDGGTPGGRQGSV